MTRFNSDNIKYYLLFFTVALFLFIPYFYSLRLEKNIFRIDFYLIWVAGCACWLYNLFFFSIFFNRLSITLLAGCSYVLILCFTNEVTDEKSIYALITLICFIGITFFLQQNKGPKFSQIIVLAICLVYVFQLLIGFSQAIRYDFESLKIKGLLFNSGFYANYLASLAPLVLGLALSKKIFKGYIHLVALTVFSIAVVILLFTVARSAMLGVAIGSIFVLCYQIKKIGYTHRLFLFIICLFLVPLLIIFLYKMKPESAKGRLTVYRVSANIIGDNLLTGVGPNRFAAVYNVYQSEYLRKEQVPIQNQLLADNTLEAFNSIVQVFVEYGVIGLIILIVFIYQLIKEQKKEEDIKEERWLRIGSIGCLISIFVCSLFSNPFHITPMLLILAFHLAMILPSRKVDISFKKRKRLIPRLIAIFFAMFVSHYAFVHYRAEAEWEKASELAKYYTFANATKEYEKAFPTLKNDGDFLFNYGAEASLAGNYDLAITLLEEAKKYNSFSNLFLYLGDAYSGVNQFILAEKNYLQAIYITPSRIFPKFQLIQLYKKWNKLELAKTWGIKTLEYPVKIKSPMAEDLLNEIKEGIKN